MLKTLMARSTIIACACSLSLAANAMADGAKRAIHIPATDLATALELLAKQSAADLVYRPDQVQGFRTRDVDGDLSIEEAVEKLLKGTPLTLSMDSTGAMLIALPTAAPSEAAAAPGTQATKPSTDTQGTSQKKTDVDEVIVTGSRLKTVDAEAAMPVNIYTRQDIERSGQPTLTQFLNTLNEVSVQSSEAIIQHAGGMSSVQLRGLPGGHNSGTHQRTQSGIRRHWQRHFLSAGSDSVFRRRAN